MRRVYESADLVISWLGPNDWSLAFSTINTLAIEITQCEDEQTFSELTWMKKYPELCEDGDENSNQDIKVSFEAILDLLNNSYWQRVWIFQEVVLATRLFLVGTGDSSLNWTFLRLVWLALDSLTERTNNTLRRKPNFISTDVWRYLTTPRSEWERIGRISWVRNSRQYETRAGLEKKRDSWLISTYGGEFEASDPKDHIYGLLGITEFDITPDYSTHKSVSDVYTEYVLAWLEVMREPGILYDEFHPLYFLKEAGIKLFGHPVGFPTWAPNYFDNSDSKRRVLSNSSATTGFANREVFKGGEDEYPYICSETKSLFVRGVRLEHIVTVLNVPGEGWWANGDLLDFIQAFMSRHPQYVSGIPPLQAFYRVVNLDSSSSINHSVISHALAFLEVLCSLDQDPSPLNLTIRNFLGLTPGNFDQQIIQNLFPEADPKQHGFQETLESYLEQYDGASLEDSRWRVILNLAKLATWSFIETTSGYLGLSPVGTKPGDILYVLKHCEVPVVLRKAPEGEHYLFVGTTFVVGLMDGEAVEFINSGRSKPEWYELR
jgi:hypothetical protein